MESVGSLILMSTVSLTSIFNYCQMVLLVTFLIDGIGITDRI